MKIIKQSVGIDVSKDSIECCFGSMDVDQNESFSNTKSFSNSEKGFQLLYKWIKQQSDDNDVWVVMEATGVYYENLAYWLLEKEVKLSVFLPTKINHFAKTLELKTKTDKVDAKIICKIGLERKLKSWSVPSGIMLEIKVLARENRENKAKLVVAKNQLHAKEHSYKVANSSIKRLKKQISLLESQVQEIEKELRELVQTDELLKEKVAKLETIPGVSFITIISILGETNGFALVTNGKQLVSYAGLDIRHKQSGLKEGKTKISKQGNSFIRNALYMPALCSTRHNPAMKLFYNRIIEGKPSKKIGISAVARKLLILIFTLWKNDSQYIPGFCQN